jgi:hypothetical protein
MSAKNRRKNLKTAKAQRQKKIAIVLGAIFALVLVVQVPRTLKKLHGHSSPAAAAATSQSQTPASASPTMPPTSAATLTAAASSSHLPESDVPPRRSKSQLFSFERFRSKDPFAQQVTEAVAGTQASAGAVPTAVSSSPTASTAASSSAIPTTTQVQPAQASPATASSTAGTASGQKMAAAVIEVNGQAQTVGVSQAFPQASPTFRLVSVTGQAAMIGIAGGSFASGSKTLTLQLGKSLTLMNTSGGQRYELRLVSVR